MPRLILAITLGLIFGMGRFAVAQDAKQTSQTPPAAAKKPTKPDKAAEPSQSKPVKSQAKRSGSIESAEPTILSADAASKRAEALRSLTSETGSDRYDKTNWAEVPAWRQTSFFGIRAKGQTFLYVVDCSGSMADENRLLRAKQELRRSIGALQFPQRFKVICYNDQPLPMPGDVLRSADGVSKDQLFRWLRLVEPDGGTDPRQALKIAISLKPDAIFLLSDGAFPDGTSSEVIAANRGKTPIHCIDLSGGAGGPGLKQIAKESGGQYVSQP